MQKFYKSKAKNWFAPSSVKINEVLKIFYVQ